MVFTEMRKMSSPKQVSGNRKVRGKSLSHIKFEMLRQQMEMSSNQLAILVWNSRYSQDWNNLVKDGN